MIDIHRVEYYLQWQLSQYSDNLVAGPYVVCFLAEATDLLSIQNIRPALGPSGLLFSRYCGMKQLIHEADHSALFSAEVADERNVLPMYVFMVYTGTILSFTIVSEELLQYLRGRNSVMQKMRVVWSHGTVFLFCSTMLCEITECCYLMMFPTKMFGNLFACGFSFCVLLIY